MTESLQGLFKYRFNNFSSFLLFILLALGSFWILQPFLAPILFGIIFTIELYPLFLKINRKIRSKFLTATLIVTVCSVLIIAPFIYILVRASIAATAVIAAGVNNHPAIVKITETFSNLLKEYNLTDYAQQYGPEFMNKTGALAGQWAQAFLAALPEIALFAFIALFTIFFGLRYFDRCVKFLRVYSFLPDQTFATVLSTLKKSIHSTIIANAATGALQALMIAIAVAIVTDYDAFLIFFIAFICSFVPIIGAGPVCFAVGALEMLNGNNSVGVGLIIFSFFVGIADNVSRTYFVGNDSESDEVPVFATFLAIIGGVIVAGFPGLFFGPLIVDLFFRLSPVLINEAIADSPAEPGPEKKSPVSGKL